MELKGYRILMRCPTHSELVVIEWWDQNIRNWESKLPYCQGVALDIIHIERLKYVTES